jgi:SAM-dependent MidA family methyltransferase
MVSISPETDELNFIHLPVYKPYFLEVDYPCIDDGAIIEISDDSITILQELSDLIINEGGSALIIDYGYENVVNRPYISTLQALRNHQFNPIFKDLGNADLTSHVNFTALSNAAMTKGLKVNVSSQQQFLVDHGINLRAEKLITANPAQQTTILSGLIRLISPDQMGKLFKVMIVN